MSNQPNETAIVFDCLGDRLSGIIHHAAPDSRLGVLIVVGGPQYRVGSHRQFVLLARDLARRGVPTMRFDVRGMGDSTGEQRSFEAIDDDICTAIDAFISHCAGLQHVVLWGLCDAASAAVFYAYQDERVAGMVLLNPWVYTRQGEAKTYLKHYYWQRLFNRNFWRKVFTFQFDYAGSLKALSRFIRTATRQRAASPLPLESRGIDRNLPLPIGMKRCLQRFPHPVLLILSGRDLTATEFKDMVKADREWQTLLSDSRVTRYDLPAADHTFSSAEWRNQVAAWTSDWTLSLIV